MASQRARESPIISVAETVGEETVEAFEALANETRLAILLALWEARDPGPPLSEPTDTPLSFSELYDRVEYDTPANFSYHLKKLVGPFVERTEDERYRLTTAAQRLVSTLLAGTLSEYPELEGEPIDDECHRCGGQVVIDYRDKVLSKRCPACEAAGDDRGLISNVHRPAAAMPGRSPSEFWWQTVTWLRYRGLSMAAGSCPDCSGPVSVSLHACPEHEPGVEEPCEECGLFDGVRSLFVCDLCANHYRSPGWAPMFASVPVRLFFYEHGVDFLSEPTKRVVDAVRRTEVRSHDPLLVDLTLELEGDRVEVTLDGEGDVVEVAERAASSS